MARQLSLQIIITTTLLVANIYVCGSTGQLRVSREYHDTFTNPSCAANATTDGCNNCAVFNAKCTPTDCRNCTCNGEYKTYLSHIDRCVSDSELLFFPVEDNSLMIQRFNKLKECMTYNQSVGITVAPCNTSDSSQQWIKWHEQLLHVGTSKCIQQNEPVSADKKTGTWSWYLGLESCNVSEIKQKWKCVGNYFRRSIVWQNIEQFIYLSFVKQLVWAILPTATQWQSYENKQQLFCPRSISRCTDTLILDSNCRQGEQQIPNLTNCEIGSLSSSKLQYFVDGKWKRFEHSQTIFSIYQRNGNSSVLKWDLTKALLDQAGSVFKFVFHCSPKQKRCILIKFNTKRSSAHCSKSTPIPITPKKSSSEAEKTVHNIRPSQSAKPTYPSNTPSAALHTSSKLTPIQITPTKSSSEAEKTAHNIRPKQSAIPTNPSNTPSAALHTSESTSMEPSHEAQKEGESSNIVGLVVGLLVAALVLCGIIVGFVCYKKRSRADKTSSMMKINGKGALSGDTLNPVYTSAEPKNDGGIYQEPEENEASRDCDLYEPADDHEYDYAKVEQSKKLPPQSEETEYDYAKNDNIKPALKRLPVKSNNYVDQKAATTIYDEKETEIDNETGPVYQTLEDDPQPVYQTLEVE